MTHLLTKAILATGLMTAPALAQDFTYSIIGTTGINARENAVAFLGVTTSGSLVINKDGDITGQGALVFNHIHPCQWEAPDPSDDYNCITLDVTDGAFQIQGKVVEWLHRHDDDNPLKDAIFDFADPRASERPDYAPYRISLTLTSTKATAEHLVVWGLSGGNVENHTTGASAIGMYVSGLFDTPFEVIALPMGFSFNMPQPPNIYSYAGTYDGGTPISAGGLIALTYAHPSTLTWTTDPEVYERDWVLPIESGEFSAEDLEAMQITQADSRGEDADEIQDNIDELGETGILPSELWLNMVDAYGDDPNMDPVLREALNGPPDSE